MIFKLYFCDVFCFTEVLKLRVVKFINIYPNKLCFGGSSLRNLFFFENTNIFLFITADALRNLTCENRSSMNVFHMCSSDRGQVTQCKDPQLSDKRKTCVPESSLPLTIALWLWACPPTSPDEMKWGEWGVHCEEATDFRTVSQKEGHLFQKEADHR